MDSAEISKLQLYFNKRFHNEELVLRRLPKEGVAGLYDGDAFLGMLTRDEDEGEISYDFVMRIEGEEKEISAWELARLSQVLSEKLNDPKIEVRARDKKRDSAEVYTGDEFIGIVFCDVEDEDGMMSFNMGILDIDLEDMVGSA